MFGPSFVEILVVLVIALLVLGPQRLPGIARMIGKGLREVRRAQHEIRGIWTEAEESVRVEDIEKPPDSKETTEGDQLEDQEVQKDQGDDRAGP